MNRKKLLALLLALALLLGSAACAEGVAREVVSEAVEPEVAEALDFGDTGLLGEDSFAGEASMSDGEVLAPAWPEDGDDPPAGLEIEYEDVAGAPADYYEPSNALVAGAAEDFTVENGVLTACDAPSGSINIPADLGITAIGEGVFRMRSDVTAITLPEGVRTIGKGAFEGCYRLASAVLPKSLRTIGINAFAGCHALSQIDLPDKLKNIGSGAFLGAGLEEVIIPANAKMGKKAAFDAAVWLYVYAGSPAYGKASALENPMQVLDSDQDYILDGGVLVKYVGTAATVAAPKGIKTIGKYAFANRDRLLSVTLSKGVRTIAEGAFMNCPSLSEIALPEGLKTIKDQAFIGDAALKRVQLPRTLVIGDDDIFDVKGMTFVVYAGSPAWEDLRNTFAYIVGDYELEVIGEEPEEEEEEKDDYVVENGVLMEYNGPAGAVVIPGSLGITAINAFAFSDAEGVTSITIPASVTRIANGSEGDEEDPMPATRWRLYIPSTLLSFKVAKKNTVFCAKDGMLCLKDGDILIRCPRGKKGALDLTDQKFTVNAFEDCRALTSISVTMENIVGYDGGWDIHPIADTFGTCSGLERIQVTQSGEHFSHDGAAYSVCSVPEDGSVEYELALCPHAKKGVLDIPEGVTTMRDWEGFHSGDGIWSDFVGYSGITTIRVPSTLPYAEMAYCDRMELPNLTAFEVSGDNPSIKSIDGVIYSKDGKTLLRCPHGKAGVFTVPKGVTAIGPGAFTYCRALEKIVIPGSVKTIGERAFGECTGLKALVIPASVKRIDSFAFDSADYSDEGDGVSTLNCKVGVYDASAAHAYCQRNGIPYYVVARRKGLKLTGLSAGGQDRFYNGDKVKLSATSANADGTVRYTFRLYREGRLVKMVSRQSNALTYTLPMAGAYTLKVVARDASGQTSAQRELTFTVIDPPEITGVRISRKKLALVAGESATLTAEALPEDAKDRGIVWSSSDSAVATVSKKGKVTGRTAGTATITATSAANGKKTAVCKVTVIPKQVLKKTGDNGAVKVKKGTNLQIVAQFATRKGWKVKSWKSSDKTIATVSSDGLVKAKKAGTATITVKTTNGKTATLKVEVVK